MRTRSELQLEFKRLAEIPSRSDAEDFLLDTITALLNVYDVLDGLEEHRDNLGRFKVVPDLLWTSLTNDLAGVRKLERQITHKTGG